MSAAGAYALLFVLAMSAAGIAAGFALFLRNERREFMPLYEVKRTDEVQPGEFESAYVLAKGTATARKRVSGALGVKPNGANVVARRIQTANVPDPGVLLTAYYDEREPVADEYAGDVSAPDAFNF